MNKDVKKYLNEVKLIIPLQSKDKNEFLSMLKQRINDSQLTSYQDIVNEIGQPTEIAYSFLSEMESEQVLKQLNRKHYLKIVCIIIIVVTLITGAVRIYYLTELYNEIKDNHPTQYEEIIEEE